MRESCSTRSNRMKPSPFDPIQQIDDIDSRILASMERISQAFRVLLWSEGKELGLSPIQLQMLIFLRSHDPELAKVSHLASEFNVTKATISESVKTLESKGLIFRDPEPHDSRSHTIRLTEEGAGIADKTSDFAEPIQIPIHKLGKTEKEAMLQGLLSTILHLNRMGVISVQRMCQTCQFYRRGPDSTSHFCTLLNHHLLDSELRVDCPEHHAY